MADVLASVGGLMRSLILFGNVLISPYSNHAIYSLLSKVLIRVVPSTSTSTKLDQKYKESRQNDFYNKYGNN